jgi:hypothetical protein
LVGFDPDWRRFSRWCVWGALAMLIWLLVPVVRCSAHAFRDEPLGEVDEQQTPGQADKERVEEGQSFVARVGHGVKVCYLRTPISSRGWKSAALYTLVGAAIVFGAIDRWERRRKRTAT